MLLIVIQVITTYTMGVSICNIFFQMLLLVSKLFNGKCKRSRGGRKKRIPTNKPVIVRLGVTAIKWQSGMTSMTYE